MKKFFLLTTALLWVGGALLGLAPVRASHAQAGELTYFSLGNNMYRVRVTFFRDCSGISAPSTFIFTAKQSCAGSTSITAGLFPPVSFPAAGSYTAYQPYCGAVAATQPACTPGSSSPVNALANTVSINYEAVVTLPPAAEWILSVEEGARPAVANLHDSGATVLRLEATLNNLITPTGGGPIVIENNSPQFTQEPLPVPFVCWRQETTLAFTATDADRLNFPWPGAAGRPDSMAYSLDRPLNGCGTYETYSSYPSGCITGLDPRCPTRIIRCMGVGATYSQDFPISVAADTVYENGTTTRPPCPSNSIVSATVTPALNSRFAFNSLTGSFRFTPNRFLNTPSASGDNKYVVVGKVTEYRKINGRYYKIGSVRRDFLVIVIDCGTNQVPEQPTLTVADTLSHPLVVRRTPDTLLLTVRSCSYTRLQLHFRDPDAGQSLTVFYPVNLNATLLQSGDLGTFDVAGNGTAAPVGTFHFQPSANLAGTRVVVPFRIEDNACPAKGIQYCTLIVTVAADDALRIGVGADNLGGDLRATLCSGTAGNSLRLTGNVRRPDSVRNVVTGQMLLQQYFYQWTAAATGGLPAATNTASIVVTPTATTRYFLTAVPSVGFSPGCGDTASVLVRLVPPPTQPIITPQGNTLVSSATTGNQWYLNSQPIAGARAQVYTPLANGSYTVTESTGTLPIRVRLAAFGGAGVCAGQPGRRAGHEPGPGPEPHAPTGAFSSP